MKEKDYPSIKFYSKGERSHLLSLEEKLKGLEPGSLILPEKIASKVRNGSPHFYERILQKTGHRNLLGLTIESSLTPKVTYPYLSLGLKQIFRWGIDASWEERFFEGLDSPLPGSAEAKAEARRIRQLIPEYLKEMGVAYLLGHTPAMEEFARNQSLPVRFRSGPYTLYGLPGNGARAVMLSRKPLGFLDLRVWSGSDPGAKEKIPEFLLRANQLKIAHGTLHMEEGSHALPIVNLNLLPEPRSAEKIARLVSGILLYNTDSSHRPRLHHAGALVRTGLPLYLVGFDEPEPGPKSVPGAKTEPSGSAKEVAMGEVHYWPLPEDSRSPEDRTGQTPPGERKGRNRQPRTGGAPSAIYLPLRAKKFTGSEIEIPLPVEEAKLQNRSAGPTPPSGSPPATRKGNGSEEDCRPILVRSSYFPLWKNEGSSPLLQTENNLTYLCAEGTKVKLRYEVPLNRMITLLFYLLPLILLAIRGTPRLRRGVAYLRMKKVKIGTEKSAEAEEKRSPARGSKRDQD